MLQHFTIIRRASLKGHLIRNMANVNCGTFRSTLTSGFICLAGTIGAISALYTVCTVGTAMTSDTVYTQPGTVIAGDTVGTIGTICAAGTIGTVPAVLTSSTVDTVLTAITITFYDAARLAEWYKEGA